MSSYDPSTVERLTFADRVPGFLDGSDSPRALLEECLATIDSREPEVRAWVARREDAARVEADAATERYLAGRPRSSIDGLPFGVKDVLETNDLPTACGFAPFAGRHTGRDTAAARERAMQERSCSARP